MAITILVAFEDDYDVLNIIKLSYIIRFSRYFVNV